MSKSLDGDLRLIALTKGLILAEQVLTAVCYRRIGGIDGFHQLKETWH